MTTGACRNCGYHCDELNSRAWCAYCLTFWYSHGRFPTRNDEPWPATGLRALYDAMDWAWPAIK